MGTLGGVLFHLVYLFITKGITTDTHRSKGTSVWAIKPRWAAGRRASGALLVPLPNRVDRLLSPLRGWEGSSCKYSRLNIDRPLTLLPLSLFYSNKNLSPVPLLLHLISYPTQWRGKGRPTLGGTGGNKCLSFFLLFPVTMNTNFWTAWHWISNSQLKEQKIRRKIFI